MELNKEQLNYFIKTRYVDKKIIVQNVNKLRTATTERLAQRQSIHYRMLQVAILLDEDYADHIKESEEFWTFDFDKGRIIQLKGFAVRTANDLLMPLFRNEDDARIACRFLRKYIKNFYGNRKQKSN